MPDRHEGAEAQAGVVGRPAAGRGAAGGGDDVTCQIHSANTIHTQRGASRNIAGSRSLLDLGLVRHDLHEEGLLVHRERGRALLISGRVLGLEDCA
jgi:hypothetical protein